MTPTSDKPGMEAIERSGNPTGRSPAKSATDDPLGILHALAAELGNLGAERDYARATTAEDKGAPHGLSSPQGESVQ